MRPPATDAFDTARQAAWEVEATDRAIKRYREFADNPHRDPAELPPGRRALAETVGPVSAYISTMMDEAATSGDGRGHGWHAPLLLFNPDVVAFIAVACALRSSPLEHGMVGSSITAFARRLGATLRDQADHDRFVRDSRKAAKTDPEAGELLARWTRCNPEGGRRAWGRFSARLEGARSARWSETVCLEIAGALATALAQGAHQWFEVKRAGPGLATHQAIHILLTPHAVEQMLEADTRAEVARPMMLPMLIPPNPWRYAPKPELEAA